jgi:hypothetical protein
VSAEPPIPSSAPAATFNADLLNLALSLLSARAMVLVPLVLGFALFAWAMAVPSVLGVVIASLFATLVFLPLLFTYRGSHAS